MTDDPMTAAMAQCKDFAQIASGLIESSRFAAPPGTKIVIAAFAPLVDADLKAAIGVGDLTLDALIDSLITLRAYALHMRDELGMDEARMLMEVLGVDTDNIAFLGNNKTEDAN